MPMRVVGSWITGIAAFIALFSAFTALGNVMGVPVQILFDEPVIVETRYYEEERDSAFTTFGLCALVVSIMLASRVGMAVRAGSWRGNVGAHGEIQFVTWLVGISALGCFGAILYLAFRDFHGTVSGLLFNFFELAAAAGIAWAARAWHDQRVQSLEALSRQGKADRTAVRVFMSEAQKCAQAMRENSVYISRELANVGLDNVTHRRAEELCSKLLGTAHDISGELQEMNDSLREGATKGTAGAAATRITQWLSDDGLQMHRLVTDLDVATKTNPRYGTAFILISESAVNILNCINSTRSAADLIGHEAGT